MYALTFDRFGGPEVLTWREVPDPELPPGHALVRMRAIGLNFADIYRRRGNYHLAGDPPFIAGYEGAGVIEAIRPAEPDPAARKQWISYTPQVGDRVGFADSPFANAELVAVPFDRLVSLPEEISFETAAAVLLQGLTAQYLIEDSYKVEPGAEVVVHAAAGGVGLLLVQMARYQEARVLGLTSTEEKRQAVLEAGADAVALYSEDWVQAAHRFSSRGKGVDVVYDSVGRTLNDSLSAVRTGGTVVFFGMAGGDPDPVDPRRLMDGSKSLIGGDLWNVLTSHTDRILRSGTLFGMVRDGVLRVRIAGSFPLAQGAEAHRFLESRAAIGKVLLLP